MIDFRYHLVSIVAVFLALAVGIVLGSAALNGPITNALRRSVVVAQQQADRARAAKQNADQQLNGAQSFAQANSHLILGDQLSGQHVVLVEAPGAPGAVTSGVASALTEAGAVITGHVQLQAAFLDPSSATQSRLGTLAKSLTPAGLTLTNGSSQAEAAQVLAAAIVSKDGPGQPAVGVADSGSAAILSGFAAGGFLTDSGAPSSHANLAVVIIPASPPATGTANAASQSLVTVGQQINLADQGTVFAGSVSGSGPGSAIDVLRTGGHTRMSSVDNADTPIGQYVVVQALSELTRGHSGNYGIDAGATAPGPSPAPSPSPSATPTATPNKSAHRSHRAATG